MTQNVDINIDNIDKNSPEVEYTTKENGSIGVTSKTNGKVKEVESIYDMVENETKKI